MLQVFRDAGKFARRLACVRMVDRLPRSKLSSGAFKTEPLMPTSDDPHGFQVEIKRPSSN